MRLSRNKFELPTLSTILIGLGILGVCALAAYNLRDALFGAPLRVQAAADGTIFTDTFVPLTGSADHAKTLLINGRPIAIDRQGDFNDAVLLSPGYNIVEVAFYDKFGNEKRKTYHWYLDQERTVADSEDQDRFATLDEQEDIY